MSCVPKRNADRLKAQLLTINFQSKLSKSMALREQQKDTDIRLHSHFVFLLFGAVS
jgi:hypothetical protein